jgi:hypothetical protein
MHVGSNLDISLLRVVTTSLVLPLYGEKSVAGMF